MNGWIPMLVVLLAAVGLLAAYGLSAVILGLRSRRPVDPLSVALCRVDIRLHLGVAVVVSAASMPLRTEPSGLGLLSALVDYLALHTAVLLAGRMLVPGRLGERSPPETPHAR